MSTQIRNGTQPFFPGAAFAKKGKPIDPEKVLRTVALRLFLLACMHRYTYLGGEKR